jgi:hypothetical protein
MPGAEAGEVTIKLHQPKAYRSKFREVTIAKHTPGTGWKWQPLNSVDFVEGQKFITVTLSEGQAAVGGISIDTPKFIDAAPPSIQVLYPKAGSKLSAQGDAVIVKAFDDLKLSHFDVLLDGKKTGLSYPALNDSGPMIFHIPGSLLEKRSRKIEILAYDASGKGKLHS